MAGNAVLDRVEGGRYEPGGPSLYSARAAAALGARVTLISCLPAGYPAAAVDGLDVLSSLAEHAAVYENAYDAAKRRTQHLLDEGEPLPLPAGCPVPDASAVLLAPAYHELDGLPDWSVPVVAVALQGVLRTSDANGLVRATTDPRAASSPFLREGILALFSDEDLPGGATEFAEWAARTHGVTSVVTHGHRGCTAWQPGRPPARFASYPSTHMVDPTGAGDCFAAAFLVHTVETGDPLAACRFANAAASLSTEGHGLEGVPTRARVEQRMLQGAA